MARKTAASWGLIVPGIVWKLLEEGEEEESEGGGVGKLKEVCCREGVAGSMGE